MVGFGYTWHMDCRWVQFEARQEIGGDDMVFPTQSLTRRHIVAILCQDGTVG